MIDFCDLCLVLKLSLVNVTYIIILHLSNIYIYKKRFGWSNDALSILAQGFEALCSTEVLDIYNSNWLLIYCRLCASKVYSTHSDILLCRLKCLSLWDITSHPSY